MSIKNQKPKKGRFKQGYFPVTECRKYVGNGPIIYRSSWEKKFCIYCENNPTIVKWSSEPFTIPYFHPGLNKTRNYYPDFYMETNDGLKYVIEVKPKSQIKKPSLPKRKTKKQMETYKYLAEQYVMNMAKFKYAIKWAENRGWKFIIVTEDFFGSR